MIDLRIIKFAFLLISSFLYASVACAATIYFNNGDVKQGKILSRNAEKIKLDYNGISLTYYSEDIGRIVYADDPLRARCVPFMGEYENLYYDENLNKYINRRSLIDAVQSYIVDYFLCDDQADYSDLLAQVATIEVVENYNNANIDPDKKFMNVSGVAVGMHDFKRYGMTPAIFTLTEVYNAGDTGKLTYSCWGYKSFLKDFKRYDETEQRTVVEDVTVNVVEYTYHLDFRKRNGEWKFHSSDATSKIEVIKEEHHSKQGLTS